MIHTTRQSPKFIRLVRMIRPILGNSPIVDADSVATAVLEKLWHSAISGAIRGDIGRFTNDVIAEMCGWLGDADQLVSMLVECGWLDVCPVNRLLIHDWSDHAPRHVKANAAKQGGFLTPQNDAKEPPIGDHLKDENDAKERTPNLTKPNLTKPEREGRASPLARPSLEEVRKYREERKSSVDAEKFFDHYEANGWVQSSGRPIGDWQAAFRTWEKREADFPSKSKPEYKPPGQRKKDPRHEYEMQRSKLVKLAREEAWDDARLRAAIEKIKPKQAQGASP